LSFYISLSTGNVIKKYRSDASNLSWRIPQSLRKKKTTFYVYFVWPYLFLFWYSFIFLGVGVFLLVFKVLYIGGVYDTWAPRDGDVTRIMNLILSLSVIFGYLFKSPFGGELFH
jgi:hypothetical protein